MAGLLLLLQVKTNDDRSPKLVWEALQSGSMQVYRLRLPFPEQVLQ